MRKLCDAFHCGYCKHGKCQHPLAPGFKYPMSYCRNYKEFKRREENIISIPYGKLDREYFWDTNFPPEPVRPPKAEKHQEPCTEPERKMANSINLSAAQPKEEKQMHRITIALKCGKEISWDTAEDKPMESVMLAQDGYLRAKDGRVIHTSRDEIASVEIVPLVKCPHCGRFVLPDTGTARTLAGDKYHAEICPECGAEM